jgi:Na+/glutamate symporter
MEHSDMSDGIAIAMIAGIFGVLAGIPALIGVILTAKTRQENTDQHGQSQEKLDLMTRHVEITGLKVDYLGEKVNDLSEAQNLTADRLDRHLSSEDS